MSDPLPAAQPVVATSRRFLDQRLRMQMLRLVDAVEAQRSLLKASAVLCVTQPALTKSIQELESILQVRLFDRHSRGMIPTEAGLRFARAARRILADIRHLDEELDELANPSFGSITLGALPVAASGVLPGALTRLKLSNPNIKIRLHQGSTEQLLPLLAANEIEIVVGRLYQPVMPDDFTRETLWHEPLSICARSDHPLFSLPLVTIDDLKRYELILPSLGQRMGQEISDLVSKLRLRSERATHSSSHGFIREILHATELIAITPRLMMAGDLARGTLGIVPVHIGSPERPAGLITVTGRELTPTCQTFVGQLHGYVAEIVERSIGPMNSSG
ncbi:LysR family transcriptional regulator [Paraburkholderia monticola]|uniref:LysR family transcriptional regulator n=1 Tax=Paraburkholderia monticola TaxID=1399968 RepID=A0A149PKZ7_9BURK|nr:LysR substrate-binding domain-containing protein [Paraburkholderia monticola]KXU85566.1 LysR family transcriptional regulator [Paraburkholderia monticola]